WMWERRTGMRAKLFGRSLLAAASMLVAISMMFGQAVPKKPEPRKAPVKASNEAVAKPASDLPTIQYEKYTLPNGLVVILSQDHRLPLVATNIWYHVGPANELPGRTGFAHLFEHMMFEGSKHVPGNAHIRLLEAAGASNLNGTTDFDRTNYFETVPSN